MQELDLVDSLNDWLYTSALTSGKTELSNQATRNVFTKDLALEKCGALWVKGKIMQKMPHLLSKTESTKQKLSAILK